MEQDATKSTPRDPDPAIAELRRYPPIRSENRATLVTALRGAAAGSMRSWPIHVRADSIAEREGCTARQVNMTISLAFLAPDLVKAAIEGRLPHGMGVRRLRDMPPEWAARDRCSASSEILPAIRSATARLEFSAGNQDFEGGDFAAKSGPPGKCCLCRDQNSDKKPAAQRVFGGFQEPRAFAKSAWWAREDSNLQPDRYERWTASRSWQKSPAFNDFHTLSRVFVTVVSGAKLVR